ncbi:MAG: VanZ family protein [Lachnospiraceae bacterium]|nr:VanZ family protein [Lachnospiraceae bacterium]
MGKKIIAAVTSLGAEQIRLLLLAGWILVMYLHSMTPAALSTEESSHVLLLITGLFTRLGIDSRWLTEHILRKTAHFCEYSIFGMLLIWNFRNSRNRMRRQRERGLSFLYPLALSVFAVPFLDETIQLFVPGRSAQISDVWLDIAGSCFGILLYRLGLRVQKGWRAGRRRRRRGWRY